MGLNPLNPKTRSGGPRPCSTREMRDSSPSVGSPEALVRRMARDGYLFLPGLLDPAEILHVRRAVIDELAGHGWLAPGPVTDPPRPKPGPAPTDLLDSAIVPTYAAVQRLEALHQLAYAHRLLEVIEHLLGGPMLVYPQKTIRLIWPNIGKRAHQDFKGIQGTADAFVAWVPLGDCTRRLGSLRVAPGSHHEGYIDRDRAPGRLDGLFKDRWARADMAAGDVVIFHCLTVHGAPNNRGDELRLSVDFRYQAQSDPVCQSWLGPVPPATNWDELTQGWSSRRWVELPEGATVVPDVPVSQWPTLPVPPSRFARAVPGLSPCGSEQQRR